MVQEEIMTQNGVAVTIEEATTIEVLVLTGGTGEETFVTEAITEEEDT